MWNQEVYQKAIDFAAKAHKNQKVPGKPYSYVVHLANVGMEVMRALFVTPSETPDLAIRCALLHDVLEDTKTTAVELEKAFGPEVLHGVMALTKDKTLAKADQIKDSLERINKQPMEIGMVKLADRITNLQPPPSHWDNAKIRYYIEESRMIYDQLVNNHEYLVNRLADKIKAYEQFT